MIITLLQENSKYGRQLFRSFLKSKVDLDKLYFIIEVSLFKPEIYGNSTKWTLEE